MRRAVMHGAQIYLRPLEESDIPRMTEWVNDPEITRFTSMYRPTTERNEREFLERIAGSNEVGFGIARVSDDLLIGTAGLFRIDWRSRNAGFGIAIGDKDEWSKGIGRETTGLILRYAFETLNLHRVWLEVFEYNPRGIKAYEAMGFTHEGVEREHVYRDGRYWNVLMMGILRSDWDGRRDQR
jgi:RimJ/RimL family protein N-acetyltransferase